MRLSPPATFRTATVWAVAVAVGLLFAIGLATAPVATADTCDNATLRAQNDSTELADCRAYEMVSPPFKAGFPVWMVDVADTDDGIVSFKSVGSFSGTQQGILLRVPYYAERSSVGWRTTAPAPSPAIYDVTDAQEGIQAESADLRQSLWAFSRRDVPGDPFGLWLRDPDGAFTRVGDALPGPGVPSVKVRLVSDDLSHVVFNYGTGGGAGVTGLWEQVGIGNGPPYAVSVDNQGQPVGATPGDPNGFDSCPRSMSADGRVIVFSVSQRVGSPCGLLTARIGGAVTVAVSGSECTRTAGDVGGVCNPAAPAQYEGTADDGSRVFFTTSQQLVNGDIDQANDLYACEIPDGVPTPVGSANPCASLAQVSGTATNARVENVVAVSKDGSRVYFVAQGVLAGNLGVGDVGPATGASAHSLYLWERDDAHPEGQTRFISRLVDGLGGNDLTRGQMTPDGRYLLFATANPLVTAGPDADTDGARDVYRYDAETPSIERVSTSVAGGGGNAPFDASPSSRLSMTDDGSTVIFDTTEALSETDANGITDVYAWRDGHVSRISSGGVSIAPGGGGDFAVITPSGRDVFFTTNARVLAADGDASIDIYTARVGGGFAPPPPPAACSGDGCQGLVSGAPGLAGPRSGLSGDSDPGAAAATLSLRAVTAAQRRRLAVTGKLALTVAANMAGRVSATARAKIAGRSVTVGTGRQTMTRPGSVAVGLRLSRKARSRLAVRGRLTVKVVVSHSKAARGRSVTLKLTKKARASKASVGGRS